jgi:TonB family protein
MSGLAAGYCGDILPKATRPEGVVLAHLIASRRERLVSQPAILIAALMASVELGLVMPSPKLRRDPTAKDSPPLTPAVYLLPLWPTQHSRPHAERVQWAVVARGHQPEAPAVRAHASPKRVPAPPAPAPQSSAPTVPTEYEGSRVYIEPELEHPVARDPSSDGPRYPELLRKKGVEGLVVVRFIVDTSGHADSTTLHIVMATQPEFEEAVRTALPRMRFIPAQLGDKHVPELVMQEFRFIMERPDTVTAQSQTRRHT